MLSRTSRVVFLMGVLGLSSLCAVAQVGVPLSHTDPKVELVTVRELVARYCRTDYSGARLNPADWAKLQPLVAWRQNPEFTLFMVASRFDVDNELVPDHGKYQVTVHYRILGKFDLAQGYTNENAGEIRDVVFTVAEVNGQWRITEIVPANPFTSRPVAVQWVNQKLAASTDAVAQTTYKHALELLQGNKTTPAAQ